MANSKVIYAGQTLIDLTADTVSADKLLAGYTAHGKDGMPITGIRVAASVTGEVLTLDGTVNGEELSV